MDKDEDIFDGYVSGYFTSFLMKKEFSMKMKRFASRNHESVWQYNMSAMPSAGSRLRARACGDPGARDGRHCMFEPNLGYKKIY